jgi:LPS export ABC transporter protein LptC
MNTLKKILASTSPFILLAIIMLLVKTGEFKLTKTNNNGSYNDMYMHNAHITIYDKLGHLAEKIQTPLLKHKTPDDIDELNQPQSKIFNTDGSIWNVTSDHGKTNTKTNITILTGHVIMHRPATQTKPDTVIKTNKVIYNANTKMAYCPEHVKVIQPNQISQADSAVINTKTHEITGKKMHTVEKNSKE